MSASQNKSVIPPLAYDEAGEWFARHRADEMDDGARRAFDEWLRASPQHVQAYLEISSTWEDVPKLGRAWNPSAEELIAQGRDHLNVLPLREDPRDAVRSFDGRRGKAGWLAIAATLLVLIGAAGFWFQTQHAPLYVTAIGEQRFITLPDGSSLQLNSNSRVKVDFSARARRIALLQGQGMFTVARDPARPFIVESDTAHVQALGTLFDVYRRHAGTVVTVIDGRVSVSNLVLTAGEQVTLARAVSSDPVTARPKPIRPDLAVATAWTQRRLIFQSSPLQEVAEDFNRYNGRQLRILDPALETYRISGVFSSTDPEPLLQFLKLQRHMHITETRDEIQVRQK